MGVEPKIGGKTPQNGWFISWKTPFKMDDLGGKNPLFLVQHPDPYFSRPHWDCYREPPGFRIPTRGGLFRSFQRFFT